MPRVAKPLTRGGNPVHAALSFCNRLATQPTLRLLRGTHVERISTWSGASPARSLTNRARARAPRRPRCSPPRHLTTRLLTGQHISALPLLPTGRNPAPFSPVPTQTYQTLHSRHSLSPPPPTQYCYIARPTATKTHPQKHILSPRAGSLRHDGAAPRPPVSLSNLRRHRPAQ
jgi:hypothetical protein